MISELATTPFLLTISESPGVGVVTNPRVTFGSGFVDDFQVDTDSIF
jgi:hypothetical protein